VPLRPGSLSSPFVKCLQDQRPDGTTRWPRRRRRAAAAVFQNITPLAGAAQDGRRMLLLVLAAMIYQEMPRAHDRAPVMPCSEPYIPLPELRAF